MGIPLGNLAVADSNNFSRSFAEMVLALVAREPWVGSPSVRRMILSGLGFEPASNRECLVQAGALFRCYLSDRGNCVVQPMGLAAG